MHRPVRDHLVSLEALAAFESPSIITPFARFRSIAGHNTPSQSLHGSDNEEDSVDEELELKELALDDKH